MDWPDELFAVKLPDGGMRAAIQVGENVEDFGCKTRQYVPASVLDQARKEERVDLRERLLAVADEFEEKAEQRFLQPKGDEDKPEMAEGDAFATASNEIRNVAAEIDPGHVDYSRLPDPDQSSSRTYVSISRLRRVLARVEVVPAIAGKRRWVDAGQVEAALAALAEQEETS